MSDIYHPHHHSIAGKIHRLYAKRQHFYDVKMPSLHDLYQISMRAFAAYASPRLGYSIESCNALYKAYDIALRDTFLLGGYMQCAHYRLCSSLCIPSENELSLLLQLSQTTTQLDRLRDIVRDTYTIEPLVSKKYYNELWEIVRESGDYSPYSTASEKDLSYEKGNKRILIVSRDTGGIDVHSFRTIFCKKAGLNSATSATLLHKLHQIVAHLLSTKGSIAFSFCRFYIETAFVQTGEDSAHTVPLMHCQLVPDFIDKLIPYVDGWKPLHKCKVFRVKEKSHLPLISAAYHKAILSREASHDDYIPYHGMAPA